MRTPNTKSVNLQSHYTLFGLLLFACWLAVPGSVKANEDPPGCSVASGGLGNASRGGINFNLPQAHQGDVVQVFPSVGMVAGACNAINVTGTVYIATGSLSPFLVNATLQQGNLLTCPRDGLCQPGPYNILLTPALIGAGVSSPKGSVAGGVKAVRAVQNIEGTIQTAHPQDVLSDFHTATIDIVTPCIQAVAQYAYPTGTNCFPPGAPIQFTGYVINCGDIRLTNVMVAEGRQLLDAGLTDPNGFPLVQPLTLDPGQAVGFQGSFAPTVQEASMGTAMNVIRATARDITAIGGPNAFVTNQTAASAAVCRAAIENPPGCSSASGGLGNTSQGSLYFILQQAHVGDFVPVFPNVGMVAGACRAVNVTGTVYIATGPLTNFLVNATLLPGELAACPFVGACEPGPYNILITPALVGAAVTSPKGNAAGVSKAVRVVQNVEGAVRTALTPDVMSDFHAATINIVTPCIQVVEECAYPAGTNSFPERTAIQFTAYVTNCGDIRLTNVTVVNSRTAQLLTPDGIPLFQPLSLDPGQAVPFKGSFAPTLAETCAGTATNAITVRGTDITGIGGPNASVTNQTTVSCAICCGEPCLAPPAYYFVNGQFQFTVMGPVGSNYVVQASTNLGTSNWLSLWTNAAPFTFVESNAVLYPARFYRAMFLP